MPSGEQRGRPAARSSSRGFTWWGLLLVLAVSGAMLAALGASWSTQSQREREAELRFRGEQIREAIGRYRGAREPAAWPQTLDDLLTDRRGGFEGGPRHHLRRRWTDPFTGSADWELLPAPAPQTGFLGVRSRSPARRLTLQGAAAHDGEPRVSDWRFVHAAETPVQTPRAPTRRRGGTP
jgi:type II secretory pathway pseudopilin PulG